MAGLGGLPRWVPFLDELAKTRTVIVPSLPGYPGGGTGHTVLDTHLDWVIAVRQLIDKAGLAGAAADNWTGMLAPAEDANSVEWPIEMVRASEAAARAFWLLGNTGWKSGSA